MARLLYHLVRADLLERVRRSSFLVTLGVTLFLCYSVGAGDISIRWGDYRGLANAGWIGANSALVAVLFLSLAGFYLVKDCIARDVETRVGEVLAASRLTAVPYLWGKTLSNVAYLLALLALPALAALLLLRSGEGTEGGLWVLWSPFLLVAIPVLCAVAACAVFFETVPGLRGGLGNFLYFFLWARLVAASNQSRGATPLDMLGFGLIKPGLRAAVEAQHPGAAGFFDITFEPRDLATFTWPGIAWTAEAVRCRLFWFLPFLLLPFAGALFFHRFDTAPPGSRRHPLRRLRRAFAALPTPSLRLPDFGGGGGFAGLLAAELRLALGGRPLWWIAGLLGIVAWSLAAPYGAMRSAAYPVAWIWPLLVWSRMGSREVRENTAPLVFSAPVSWPLHLLTVWLSGVAVAVLAGCGVLARALAAGDWGLASAWAAGALFVPALALALGTASNGGKLFEAVYTAIWYFGPVRKTVALDFLGASERSVAAGAPGVSLAVVLLLLACAVAGRWRQIHRLGS
jgi:hypothetical protein